MIKTEPNYIGTEQKFDNGYKLAINKQLEDGEVSVWLTLWNPKETRELTIQYDLCGNSDDISKFVLEIIKVLQHKL